MIILKILLVQKSVDESSIDNKIESAVEKAHGNTPFPDIKQFYRELNDCQSRLENLVPFKLVDSNNSNADLTYMNIIIYCQKLED